MASNPYTSGSSPINQADFSGGLNSTSGSLGVAENESSDLQNIDFNKFGSILKRNGYATLNSSAISSSPDVNGLHWYEAVVSGAVVRYAIAVAGSNVYKMDDLDGTWDSITGALTITTGYHVDFENFLNEVYMTNGNDAPFKWTGSGNAAAMTVPSGLTKARFVKQFNNYLFLANVTVSGTVHKSRIYWSNLKDTGTWGSSNFIEVSKDDGQEITGIKVLGDRLVIYKTRSIYNLFFTGDTNVPFIMPGGGKSNSAVGCVAPFSIQEVENGHIFLSHDGFYFYDGNNAVEISNKIHTTLNGMNLQKFNQSVSLVQRNKNRYMCSMPLTGATENNRVLVFNYSVNAWSIYTGIAACSMATFYVAGEEERIYFGDYAGFVYRMDTGSNDNPLGVETAIDAYYYTNWKHLGDIVNKKGIPEILVYYQSSNSVITVAYSYDFETGDSYSLQLNLATSSALFDSAIFDTDVFAGEGGAVKRLDLTGRGRVIRLKFENSTVDETFQIDGLGMYAHLETNV